MTNSNSPSLVRSRLKLVAVFALFFGPMLLAVIWYYGFGAANVERGATNHAPLVSPPVPLEAFSNPRRSGGDLTLEDLRSHWTVVHRLPGSCGEGCGTALYNTRQTRIALGKDAGRVSRLILGKPSVALDDAIAGHPDITVVLPSTDGLEHQLTPVIGSESLGPDDALLIDPLGNVMMVIPDDLDPSDLLKDLKKLMKLSTVG